jgi:hypothetical protein
MPEVWQVYKVKDVDALLRVICGEWRKVFRRLRNSHWCSRFRQLWEHSASEDQFYELANELHLTCYGEELPRERWSEAWQFRLILHPDFNQAIIEFANAIIGFY